MNITSTQPGQGTTTENVLINNGDPVFSGPSGEWVDMPMPNFEEHFGPCSCIFKLLLSLIPPCKIRGLPDGSVPLTVAEKNALLAGLAGNWKIQALPGNNPVGGGPRQETMAYKDVFVRGDTIVLSGGRHTVQGPHGPRSQANPTQEQKNIPFKSKDGRLVFVDNIGSILVLESQDGGEIELDNAMGYRMLWQRQWKRDGQSPPAGAIPVAIATSSFSVVPVAAAVPAAFGPDSSAPVFQTMGGRGQPAPSAPKIAGTHGITARGGPTTTTKTTDNRQNGTVPISDESEEPIWEESEEPIWEESEEEEEASHEGKAGPKPAAFRPASSALVSQTMGGAAAVPVPFRPDSSTPVFQTMGGWGHPAPSSPTIAGTQPVSRSPPPTATYENVMYKAIKGILMLYPTHLAFHGTSEDNKFKIVWDDIHKIKMSPAKHAKALLRLFNGQNLCKTYELTNREALANIQKDIAEL